MLRTSFQATLGALLFLSGFILEAAAVAGYFVPGVAALLPAGLGATYGLANLAAAAGAALVVTSRTHLRQAFGISLLFLTLNLLLPGIGPLAVLGLTLVLCNHCWKKTAPKVALEEVAVPLGESGNGCPVDAPLVGLRHTLESEDLQKALLGMDAMAPGETRPLLKSLRKHRDVRVLLYANGLLNDHLNLFEKRFARLQEEAAEAPTDLTVLTALVETYASLIENRLIAADELAETSERALASADAALELDPDCAPVLAAKARFELVRSDFGSAYATIQRLYDFPNRFEEARKLHAELLFEHEATRPVRDTRGAHVTPPVPQHVMN